MEKIIKLVDAMNDMNDELHEESKLAIYIKNKTEQGVEVTRYFIKKRPVAGEDGIETWKFVARKEK